jgi:hypothetical protein
MLGELLLSCKTNLVCLVVKSELIDRNIQKDVYLYIMVVAGPAS